MVINPLNNVCKIDAYPDTDFASMHGHKEHTDPACAKSWTEFIITFVDCSVLWQSKLHTKMALSAMEAGIIALLLFVWPPVGAAFFPHSLGCTYV